MAQGPQGGRVKDALYLDSTGGAHRLRKWGLEVWDFGVYFPPSKPCVCERECVCALISEKDPLVHPQRFPSLSCKFVKAQHDVDRKAAWVLVQEQGY